MKRIIIFIIILIMPYFLKAQLVHISIADSASYFNKEKKIFVYPNLGIEISSSKIIFIKDTIEIERNYFNIDNENKFKFFEVYDNHYLVITIGNRSLLSISEPALIFRNEIFIINLCSPRNIYQTNLNSVKIVKDEYTLNYCMLNNDFEYYIIKSIDLENLIITLLKANGELIEYKLDVEVYK
jgi:hypothetical protein